MSERVPLTCPRCGQKGNERPGFSVLDLPEAVGFNDGGMQPVDSFECNNCGYNFVTPKGMIEIRKP